MSAKRAKSIFTEYSPLKSKRFQVMDNDGKVINPDWKPEIPDEELVEAYKYMNYVRTFDLLAVSYQRQGRMYTYPPNIGQEAIGTAAGFVMKKEDWIAPAFRELAVWLKKGATAKDLYMYWGGDEKGSLFSGAENFLPVSVPIASQLIHAVGVGYAMQYQGKKGVAYGFVGDGGTSQGDFHEALNFGGVWKTPTIFVIQNNQFAISVPVSKQTAAKSLAIKSVAYGIEGIQVDGNDYLAMHKVFTEAEKHAQSGKGPVLVEAVTFRTGAHTTSDDPSLYRTKEEEEKWKKTDPIKRLGQYLADNGLWDLKDDEDLVAGYRKELDNEFQEYEKTRTYEFSEIFDTHYADVPDDLRQQQRETERFYNWEKSQS